MKWLTLEYIKARVRIDHDCENELIEKMGRWAERIVLTYIGRTYEELIATYGEVPDEIDDAALLLIDYRYQQRSAGSERTWSSVPYGFEFDLKPYQRLADSKYYDMLSED